MDNHGVCIRTGGFPLRAFGGPAGAHREDLEKRSGRQVRIEKSLETEFPGISFRNSLSGREAFLTGHRVAVWEVLAVHNETKSVAKTADHFRWPPVIVKRALAYAKAFPEEIGQSLAGETDTAAAAG